MRRGSVARRRTSRLPVLVAVVVLGLTCQIGLGRRASADVEPMSVVEHYARLLDNSPLPAGLVSPCHLIIEGPGGPSQVEDCSQPASPETSIQQPIELVESRSLHTPRWHASLNGLGSGLVRVHGFGDVARMTGNGETVWTRPAMSFYEDWRLPPHAVPFVPMGTSPVDPFAIASERPYAVGDLNDDGVEDVAIGHVIMFQKGTTTTRSAVTVVDGRDGGTLWSRLLPGYVTQVILVADTLIVGVETGPPRFGAGQAGTTSHLLALRFQPAPFHAVEAWQLDSGKQWARWLAAEPAGGNLLAVGLTDKPLGNEGTAGELLLLNSETGAVVWSRQVQGYPRILRHDPIGGRVVALEEADPIHEENGTTDIRFSYEVASYDLDTGTRKSWLVRDDAIGISMQVGDLDGSGGSDVAIGDAVTPDPPADSALGCPDELWCPAGLVIESRVFVADDTGTPRWSRSRDALTSMLAYGLIVADRDVVAASLGSTGETIERFDGATGTPEWTRANGAPFPLFPIRDGQEVVGATPDLRIRRYALADGSIVTDTPLLYGIHTVAIADVGGDLTDDLVVGTANGTVAALDGATLDHLPDVLWRTDVGGPAHEVKVADLDGDEVLEVVVAASSSVRVLGLVDGKQKYSIAGDDFVWTVALGDLTGDGTVDLVVPTKALRAYSGADGSLLWEYRPAPGASAYFSNPAIAPGRRVVVQYLAGETSYSNAWFSLSFGRGSHVVVAIEGPTGAVAWMRAVPGAPTQVMSRWRGVTADPSIAGVGGYGVATSYEVWEGPGGLVGNARPVVDVYDARNGDLAWTSGPVAKGLVDMGTTVVDQRFVEMNWFGLADLYPEGVTETEVYAVSDLTVGDFGTLGRALLASWAGVKAFPPETLVGGAGPEPIPMSDWKDMASGSVLAEDLDGDGVDEVLTWQFNWDAYAEVMQPLGVSVGRSDVLPHGITILEPREVTMLE